MDLDCKGRIAQRLFCCFFLGGVPLQKHPTQAVPLLTKSTFLKESIS